MNALLWGVNIKKNSNITYSLVDSFCTNSGLLCSSSKRLSIKNLIRIHECYTNSSKSSLYNKVNPSINCRGCLKKQPQRIALFTLEKAKLPYKSLTFELNVKRSYSDVKDPGKSGIDKQKHTTKQESIETAVDNDENSAIPEPEKNRAKIPSGSLKKDNIDKEKLKPHKGLNYSSIILPPNILDKLKTFSDSVLNLASVDSTDATFSKYQDLQSHNLTQYLSIRAVQKFLRLLMLNGSPKRMEAEKAKLNYVYDPEKPQRAISEIIYVIEDRQSASYVPKEFEYTILLTALAQSGSKNSENNLMHLFSLLLEKSRNFEQDSFFMTNAGCYKIIKAYTRLRHVKGALWIYNKMIAESDLLLSMSQSPKVSESESRILLKASRDIKPNKFVISVISNLLEKAHMSGLLFKMWANMALSGDQIPLLVQANMIRAFIKKGSIEAATWIMKVGRSIPGSYNFNQRGDQQASTGASDSIRDSRGDSFQKWNEKVDLAQIILSLGNETDESTRSTSSSTNDIKSSASEAVRNLYLIQPPDLRIHTMLIQGAISLGKFDLAQQLFDELVKSGMAPKTYTLSALATMYADKDDLGKVQAIVRRFFFSEKRVFIEKPRNNNLPGYSGDILDVQLFVPLLYLYISENRINEALEVLNAWNSLYDYKIPTEKLETAMIQIYRALGKPEAGVEIALGLRKALGSPDSSTNQADYNDSKNQPPNSAGFKNRTISVYYYKQRIAAFLEARDLRNCIKTFREMIHHRIIPDKGLVHSLLYGFLYNDSLEMFETLAFFFFEHIDKMLPYPLLNSWIQELSRRGDANGAYAVIQRIIEQGLIPHEIQYCMVIQACTLRGWTKQADELVVEMQHPDSPVKPGVTTFVSLVESHVAAGDVDGAQEILNSILSNSLISRKNIGPRAFTHVMVGHLYNKNGHKAIEVFETMLKLNISPSKYTYAALMHAYSLERKIKQVGRVLDQLIQSKIKPDSAIFTILIGVYGLMYNIRAAENLFMRAELVNEEYLRSRMRSQSIRLSSTMYPSKKTARLNKLRLGINDGAYNTRETDIDMRMPPEGFEDTDKYFIDPIMILMMIKAYIRVNNLDKAILFWKRLIESYPILKIDPKSPKDNKIAITSDFHVTAMTRILDAHIVALDSNKFFSQSASIDSIREWGNRSDEESDTLPTQKSQVIRNEPTNQPVDPQTYKTENTMDNQENKEAKVVLGGSETESNGEHLTENPEISQNSSSIFETSQTINEVKQEISLRLINMFENARKNGFYFEPRHINSYLASLLMTSQYDVILSTLGMCRATQKNPIEGGGGLVKNSLNRRLFQGNLGLSPRLVISDKNTRYLLEKLKWVVENLNTLSDSVVEREKELVVRYQIVSIQPEWSDLAASKLDHDSDLNDTSARTTPSGSQNTRPSLDDFVSKDIIMADLRRRHSILTRERYQLLHIVKAWSNFVDSEDVQRIATLISDTEAENAGTRFMEL